MNKEQKLRLAAVFTYNEKTDRLTTTSSIDELADYIDKIYKQVSVEPVVILEKPEVTRRGILDMQVCVPKCYTDEQVLEFAERENPCGTTNGWVIRREGDKALLGQPERNHCAVRKECVHIMLDC